MTTRQDGYTFELSDEVTRTPVRYQNHYGIEIAADLYQANGLDESVTHPAIVIGPPHGGVKEQGLGVRAQELAKRGFVALGFDQRDREDVLDQADPRELSGLLRHLKGPLERFTRHA